MNSDVMNWVFASPRARAIMTPHPDWERLAEQLQNWRCEDRRPGSPVERYSRYLRWSQAVSPDDGDLGRAVAFFTARTASRPDEPLWQTLCAAAATPHGPNPYD